MAKRKVKCPLCGNEWETSNPFPRGMCPGCRQQTNFTEVKDDKPAD